ncbi:hypothetical protein DB30_03493 [Enhygromyxa salina]|uniref:Uncharacterized protein n=1 Tax=Enhygromyxa salina TaxID=215803 RepID=A0A0C2D6P2_9BACT|nr:hypothetical protein DB30_03493 [Enhygromyxa salina]
MACTAASAHSLVACRYPCVPAAVGGPRSTTIASFFAAACNSPSRWPIPDFDG